MGDCDAAIAILKMDENPALRHISRTHGVSVARLIISHIAPAARQLSRVVAPLPARVWPVAVAQVRMGNIMSAAD